MKSFLIRDILSSRDSSTDDDEDSHVQVDDEMPPSPLDNKPGVGLLNHSQATTPTAGTYQLNSPLDALFQMTSGTFDALKRGVKREGKFNRVATS